MSIIARSVVLVSVLLLGASALPSRPATAVAQDLSAALASCSVILVPNELLNSHSSNTDEAFYDAMCGDWYNSHQQVVDSTLGVSAVIELIPVGVDASNTTTNTTVSRTQYCSQTNRRVSQRTKDMFWSRVVPDTARAAWSNCISVVAANATVARPIIINFQPVGERNVAMSVRYDANLARPGDPPPTLRGLSPTNLVCEDNISSGQPVIPTTQAGLGFNCQWASSDASVGAVIVRTSLADAIATTNRVLPPFLTVEQEVHTPVTKLVRTNTVCGGWFGTTDMHNWEKDGNTDGRCSKSSDDGKWCKGAYHQVVSTQSGGQLRNRGSSVRGEVRAAGTTSPTTSGSRRRPAFPRLAGRCGPVPAPSI